jgi:alkylation response protein AidB-like acyl-CoA dehydrogenase
MLVVEALGKGCEDGGLVFSLCAHMFASAVPIWRSQSAAIHERYLRDIALGKLICANGTSEPDAGSDVYAMKMTARHVGAGYVLDGTKCFITNAPIADLFLIYAVTAAAEHDKTGLRTSPWGTLYLENCHVAESALVGREGSGAALFAESMVWERACLFAYYIGAMERTLERCVEHVRSRSQFGHKIGSFQSVSNRIVDMKLRLEAGRLLLYRAGELHVAGKRCEEAVALSKLWISEAAVQTGLDAIQIFGGAAMMPDTGVDALLRDAIPSRVFSGSSEMQRLVIARMMGVPS